MHFGNCGVFKNHNVSLGWQPIQGVPCLSPLDSWDRLQQTPATQNWKEAGIENGWMDFCKCFPLLRQTFDVSVDLLLRVEVVKAL